MAKAKKKKADGEDIRNALLKKRGPKVKDLPEHIRDEIVDMLLMGFSVRRTMNIANVSFVAVNKIKQELELGGNL